MHCLVDSQISLRTDKSDMYLYRPPAEQRNRTLRCLQLHDPGVLEYVHRQPVWINS